MTHRLNATDGLVLLRRGRGTIEQLLSFIPGERVRDFDQGLELAHFQAQGIDLPQKPADQHLWSHRTWDCTQVDVR